MKKNSSYMMFVAFLFFGIMLVICSNNWLGCWMGVEMNMVSFLPFMMNKMSVYSSESMIKYFIIQSMGSSLLFLFVVILGMLFQVKYFIMISLMIKIGSPPFHYWYVSVIDGLSWLVSFLIMTVQSIIPIILLSYLDMSLILFIVLSCIWGSLGGLCYSSIRKILAYSSIYNLSWIFSGVMLMNYMWLVYFLIYSLSLFLTCYLFWMNNMNYLNQVFILFNNSVKSLMLMIIFMSMGGLPPFLGFFPKFMMIYCLLVNKMYFLCLILVMTALLVLFYYLRVVMTGLMMANMSLKLSTFSLNSTLFMVNSLLIGFMVVTLFNVMN
uniref:NADH-ubiquinone oxidoreductase chain 2 n=2 Tax=decula group TaxID=254008 RepID=A0A482DP65_9HEMI|nr:NADH dehydrogenase subunit 2 [Magicicada septendecula]YP_009590123.1 NADH dehydrogenase subunit 2 [Magicicada tredecula]QBM09095.1 NADH dehydrogenase subunit 2 [Magicicada septendecula]QBM09108.1 NADH dehydrogenase subunit 2 [Magicicada septendecula]QBM09355.1 NADH dehydrogenase subunit 2 [Magicicada septendecula]QBM09381.1 NADH dehydrogenase subunit 2 [Magicicada septendecula]QBM09394.1 NADH dehydrogenase subunit 2 [Magicicada septendecula]